MDLHNVYDRLQFNYHQRTLFCLPSFSRGITKYWPIMKSVPPMGWSHYFNISHEIQGEVLSSEANFYFTSEIRAGNSFKIGRYKFGLYIDDFFVIGYDKLKVEKVSWRAFHTFIRKHLPPSSKLMCRSLEDHGIFTWSGIFEEWKP